jgi:transcriptional regulator with XRE-family HTH domain
MKLKDSIMVERLCEELYSLSGTHREIARRIGCDRHSVTAWINGLSLPSAYHLKGMYLAGIDVIYILTGQRTR